MKKILAVFMVVIIMLTGLNHEGFAYAEEKKLREDITMVSKEDLKVEGTNSFGSLLANTLASEAEGQSDNEGYNIFSIDIQGKVAQVSFETMEDVSLVVGIYDESGIEMLASGTIAVTSDDKEASVAIDIERMPEYFYLRGFMVNEKTLRPLCTAYESPNYTKEMKEFFAKTTNDFDKEKVLNLDDDKSNNFAVFSDAVTVIPSGSALVVEKIDEENKKYVFSNADSIKALKHGDIFAYEYEDGNNLIVKIGSILEENGMVTVIGQDAVMEDVFEHVKIDTDAGIAEGTEVDTSECGDGVIYNDIVYENDNADGEMHINAKEFDKKTGGSLSYKFLENETKGISGDITVKLEARIKVYISDKYKYLEVRTDYSVKTKIGVKAKSGDDWRLPLGVVPFTPIPGVNLRFTTAFVVEVSASFEISGTLKGTLGFKAESDKGIQNISSSPEFIDLDVKGEITVFMGLSLKAEVNIVSDYLANAELEATLGAEVTGALKPNKSSSLHECKMCVDGDVSAKAGWEFKTELLNSDKLTFKLSDNISLKVADWYFSFDFGECAMTTCPHYLYKTTITVKELMKEKYIAGAVVKVPFTIIEKDGNGNEKKIKVSSVTTNENGKVDGYLPNGKYNIEINAEKYYKKKEKIIIEDEAKSIGIELSYDISDIITGEEPKDDTILKRNVQALSLGVGHSGVITEDGSLYMWGFNGEGELGDGTTANRNTPIKVLDNVISISLGGSHSGAITKNKDLYMWGDDLFGKLGDETIIESNKPSKIMGNVVMVSLGAGHSGTITEDGNLYMWGSNSHGELGDGTNDDKNKPIKVLEHVTYLSVGLGGCTGAITEDGSLYMWGDNVYGGLGDGTTIDRDRPVKVLNHVKSVSLGSNFGGAITEDGSLYMWGLNSHGQLGDGTTENSYKPLKILDNIVSISLGGNHSGAVTENGDLYMWGSNWYGELGDGTTEDSHKPLKVLDNVASISLGGNYSGAVTENGDLYMWGRNSHGQLGNGIAEGEALRRPCLPIKIMDNVKINNKQLVATKDILEKTEHRVSIKKLGDLKATETTNQGKNKKVSFTNLVPNAVYNFYVVKNKTAESLLHTSNLLYLTQATAGIDGSLYVPYGFKENSENAEIFVVCAEQDDITSATIHAQDLEYNQKQQYIQLVITYQGKMLDEYEDYELLGDYSATEIGNYTVTIHGIGDYKGSVDVSYKIIEPKSRKIEKITLSVADASLSKGNTLQLIATVFPENAENKTLQWLSSDEKIAIVGNNGLVTAVGAGKTSITVKSTDGSNISASCIVVITDNTPNPWPTPVPTPTPNPSPVPSPMPNHVPNPDPEPNPGPVIENFYYIIQFDSNSGTKLSRKTLTLLLDDNLGILPKVQRKNYKFKGWYTQKNGGDKVNSASVLNVSTTLHAQWEKISKPLKVKRITLLSKKSGQMKVSWKKVSRAFGYQVMYSTSKKFTNATTKKVFVSSVSKTIKSLKKGKTYYVKIRAYKMDSARNKIYGAYSTKKHIKVKK